MQNYVRKRDLLLLLYGSWFATDFEVFKLFFVQKKLFG